MIRNIKLTIEYDGTDFNGWQTQTARHKQSTSKSQRTIQGEIEKALKKIFKQNLKLIGSGRTDSGVHALGQVANFKARSNMPIDEIQSALNANKTKIHFTVLIGENTITHESFQESIGFGFIVLFFNANKY